jgi:hypothetical protein
MSLSWDAPKKGRLEPGYTRREPSAAAAYFQSVGLRGPFWEAYGSTVIPALKTALDGA